MKTTITSFLLLCIAEFCFTQTPCQVQFNEHFLNANNIKAAFQPGGNKFSSGSKIDAGFFAPYPYGENPSSIFASSPWVGGFDDAGNLKLAAEEFPERMNDFYPGPLTPIGLPFDIPCEQFNKIWSVYGDDIKQHIEDAQDGIIDDTIASVFGWPAYGNDYFELFNGFPLPGNHEWAGFHDLNLNDKYDPDQGEYPEVYFNNTYYVPDQTLWMVFHDADSHSVSGADPLRFEFQLTAFAFNCQENTWLNNTIFNSYKIINRAITATDNAFFGIWTDYDIGCPADDFVGSDSTRHSEFAYNQEAIDGHGQNGDCETGLPTYVSHPPVQSHTYLSQPMHSFILAPRWGDYEDPFERYNLLKGVWTDGNPIVPEGTGYMPGSSLPPTKFLFHGDPRDTSSWAETNIIQGGVDRLTVSSVKLERLDPGEYTAVESAYMFHLDTTLGHLEQFGFMYNNIDSLFAAKNMLNDNCLPFPPCVGFDCVWPGDFNHNGIADHEDLLTWGIMKDYSGASRDRLISWKGHFADGWTENTLHGTNFKHGDGDGNGATNDDDLYPLYVNYKLINPYYQPEALYPEGPEILISSREILSDGSLRQIKIEAGTDIPGVFGLAFEIDFDTSLYRIHLFEEFYCPEENPIECFFDGPFQDIDKSSENPRYAFVKTDHHGFDLKAGFELYASLPGLRLKPGIVYADLPDTVRVRLKNLIAIDSAGNDLHIGANELVYLKNVSVATTDISQNAFAVYPNPASDFIQFDIEKEMSFKVFTIHGQLCDAFTATPLSEVDISDYNQGIYFIKSEDSGWVTKLVVN